MARLININKNLVHQTFRQGDEAKKKLADLCCEAPEEIRHVLAALSIEDQKNDREGSAGFQLATILSSHSPNFFWNHKDLYFKDQKIAQLAL